MKLQNLKLDKEIQKNLRSKNDKAFRRKRDYLRHGGYERRWEQWLRTALTEPIWLRNEWVRSESDWVWEGWEKGCVWNFLVCVFVMTVVCLCVSLCVDYMSRGYRVLETRYPCGSTWHFCPSMICKKPLTRVSKTRVLLESRVLETRDVINIYCFRIGQLTILLHTLCYLARGFAAHLPFLFPLFPPLFR